MKTYVTTLTLMSDQSATEVTSGTSARRGAVHGLGALVLALGGLIALAYGQPLVGVLMFAAEWPLVGSLLYGGGGRRYGRSWWRQCSR